MVQTMIISCPLPRKSNKILCSLWILDIYLMLESSSAHPVGVALDPFLASGNSGVNRARLKKKTVAARLPHHPTRMLTKGPHSRQLKR